ncbi:MAG: hypothetical protein J5742_03440 [Alphaproteobacteria bacterium]|nr:hypothetical protein [Alphaproteobacteria bacterium]
MKAKASIVAQKLLNLYRQAHVIAGGWSVLNKIFIDEATDDVIQELKDLPTGKLLSEHINNLRSGKTPMDSISRELLPYGGIFAERPINTQITEPELKELKVAINAFTPNQRGLENFISTPVVRRFGSDWVSSIRTILTNDTDMFDKFDQIARMWNAYNIWIKAKDLIKQPVNDRVRAQLQVDLPEYETYLPMFGEEGSELLQKLHTLISSLPQQTNSIEN